MSHLIQWGIIGPGKIAHKFAAGLQNSPSVVLHAIASRDIQRGKAFAEKFNVTIVYDRYEDLAADPDIDIIYIATPHTFHHEQTIMCLNHKKAVLCEKPFSLNSSLVKEMIAAARANQVFLMEGMWSRFFPAMIKVLDLVTSGAIGEIKYLSADFGFSSAPDPQGRLLNLKLGGGAQLDIGIYPLFLVLLLLGKPDQIQVAAQLATTGADETTAIQFRYQDGAIAQVVSSFAIDSPRRAEIGGTLGSITLHPHWHKSQVVSLRKGSEIENFEFPYEGFGFEYEINEVVKCLQETKKESPLMSLDFSLMMAEVADEILLQAGVRY